METETWGLQDSVSATVDVNKKLISIGLQGQLPMTPPQAYVGRVGGSGNASSVWLCHFYPYQNQEKR